MNQIKNNKNIKSNNETGQNAGLFNTSSYTLKYSQYVTDQLVVDEISLVSDESLVYSGMGRPQIPIYNNKEIDISAVQNLYSYIVKSKPQTELTTEVGHGCNINEMMSIASSNSCVEVVNGNQ